MTAFSLGARLPLGANSRLALSLPQSRLCILWARQLPPQREPRRLPRKPQSLPCRAQGSQERTPSPLCEIPNSEFRIPHYSVPPPLQNVRARRAHLHFSCAQRARFMRRRRASCAQRAHFICEAKNAASAAFFCCSLTYLCKLQCLFRCRGRRAEAHRRI